MMNLVTDTETAALDTETIASSGATGAPHARAPCGAAAMHAASRAAKEAFVSGLSGGGVGEIAAVSALAAPVALVAAWLAEALLARRYRAAGGALTCMLSTGIAIAVVEAAFFAPRGAAPVAFTLVVAVLALARYGGGGGARTGDERRNSHGVVQSAQRRNESVGACTVEQGLAERTLSNDRLAVVTAYRGAMLLTTCVAILAVDFNAFPRRLAKTERNGVSVMDAGQGCFVAAAGMAAGLGRGGWGPPKSRGDSQTRGWLGAAVGRVRAAVAKSAPLLVLAVARPLAVAAVGYQTHVGEYGAHWSFFASLACASVVVATLPPPRTLASAWLLGGAAVVAHELALTRTPLGAWIVAEERDATLLSMNKEGVGSLGGYVALMLLGRALGGTLRSAADYAARRGAARRGDFVAALVAIAFAACGAWALGAVRVLGDGCARGNRDSDASFDPARATSRRMANAQYVLFTLAHVCSTLAGLACMEWVLESVVPASTRVYARWPPRVAQDLNDAGLYAFLAANMLTGLTNMSMDTLVASDALAATAVWAYGVAFCTIASGIAARLAVRARARQSARATKGD